MSMRLRVLAATVGLGTIGVASVAVLASDDVVPRRPPIYLSPEYPPQERAADLVSRMTLAEKASQMNSSQSAAIPRLGVAAYGWWNEAAHGVAREGTLDGENPPTLTNTTSYPVSLSLGSTWNPDLMYREASLISDEAREVVRDNTLDLNFYSPTVNLARDPRWGRNDETFSEDPLLTAAIAAQYVNGMEGKDATGALLPSGGGYLKTTTTLKHYAANNSEFNRLDGSSDMDERTLREYYTAQFRDLIRRSDPASIMTSYNRVNGVPASASGHLLDTLARQTFGFTGFVTSDCDAIQEIQHGHRWQPPGYPHPLDEVERQAFANAAGVDLDCQQGYHDGYNYANTLPIAVERGIVTGAGTYTEHDLDLSVMRLLTARIRLGEFDRESRVPWVAEARARVAAGSWSNTDANGAVTETPQRLAMARAVADESIVLLKNAPTTRRDGTTGPLLPLRVPASGPYRVAVVGDAADPAAGYLGGYSSDQGPAGTRNTVTAYQGVKAAVLAVDPAAVVDALPGVTPGTGAEVDPASVDAAAGYDAVVVYARTDRDTASEDHDRTSLALPGAQAEMIRQVAARNPNTFVYLYTWGLVYVAVFVRGVAALVCWKNTGQRAGVALADVLLGAHNPDGHLPFTWYRDDVRLPPIEDYGIRPTASQPGRTYQYFTGPVAYPFGHGLGYGTFEYANLRVEAGTADGSDAAGNTGTAGGAGTGAGDRSGGVDANGTLRVGVDVTNTGTVTGSDVVQVYVTTPDAPAALQRPVKRLLGFEKVTLPAGQTTTVTVPVKVADLAFFDGAQGRYVVDPGRYGIQVAASSADVRQQTTVTVTGTPRPVPAAVTARPRTPSDAARGVTARLMFPPYAAVEPNLTVAMSDDTRYGNLGADGQRAFPDGMTVHYGSNRPDVVSVGADGGLRTGGRGTATVTATVGYAGINISTDFVVCVP